MDFAERIGIKKMPDECFLLSKWTSPRHYKGRLEFPKIIGQKVRRQLQKEKKEGISSRQNTMPYEIDRRLNKKKILFNYREMEPI